MADTEKPQSLQKHFQCPDQFRRAERGTKHPTAKMGKSSHGLPCSHPPALLTPIPSTTRFPGFSPLVRGEKSSLVRSICGWSPSNTDMKSRLGLVSLITILIIGTCGPCLALIGLMPVSK